MTSQTPIASKRLTVGWREWVTLPEFTKHRIKVKVDTGARTSSLHVSHVKEYRRGQARFVSFVIHPKQDSSTPQVECHARLVDERGVRSSSGILSVRPVIQTHVSFGEQTWPIEVTLVNRDLMGFRMLLGREAMRGRLLVNPSRSYLLGKKKG